MNILVLAGLLALASAHEEVSIGRSVVLSAADRADEIVVIGGNADVDGDVKGSVVVVGGRARINGKVGQDAVAIGTLELGPKAQIVGDAVSVGGPLLADPAAKIGGDRTSVALAAAGLPGAGWFVEAPLKLRLISHASPWSWTVAGLFLLFYIALAAGAPVLVGKAADSLTAQPATTLLAGLLTLALAGPTLLVLVVSVAGILVVPFVLCVAAAAVLVGKAAVFSVVGRGFNLKGLAAVAAGGVLLTLPLAIPGLGLLAWGLTTAWGCGAAVLAGAALLKAENRSALPAPAAPVEPAPAAPATAAHPDLPRATFGQRLGATLLDLLFVAVLAGIAPILTMGIGAWALYQVGLWTWKGTTLGGIVVGIRGVRTDGRPMDFPVALVRHLASYFSAAACFLGFFWAAWDPEGETWHDKIAGTVVVRLPKGEPLL